MIPRTKKGLSVFLVFEIPTPFMPVNEEMVNSRTSSRTPSIVWKKR